MNVDVAMKIGLAQLKIFDNVEENLKKTLQYMEAAAAQDVKLICFPEIQLSPFFPQHPAKDVDQYTISFDGSELEVIREKTRSLGLVAFPNFYMDKEGKRYDASPVIDSDGFLLGVSKMVHIVQTHQFYEQDYYTPSEEGFKVYDTSIGKIGIVICFDRHFPESTRICALKGAELIVVPTANTKSEPLDLFEWEMRVAAYQNGVYIAMCNRVGLEDEMDFCGESVVVDPNGNIVVKAGDNEQLLIADIDLSKVYQARTNRPYLRLRRPHLYKRIIQS